MNISLPVCLACLILTYSTFATADNYIMAETWGDGTTIDMTFSGVGTANTNDIILQTLSYLSIDGVTVFETGQTNPSVYGINSNTGSFDTPPIVSYDGSDNAWLITEYNNYFFSDGSAYYSASSGNKVTFIYAGYQNVQTGATILDDNTYGAGIPISVLSAYSVVDTSTSTVPLPCTFTTFAVGLIGLCITRINSVLTNLANINRTNFDKAKRNLGYRL